MRHAYLCCLVLCMVTLPLFGQTGPILQGPRQSTPARPASMDSSPLKPPGSESGRAVVQISKTAPAVSTAGRVMVVEIAVRNVGDAPAQEVSVEDELTGDVSFLGAEPPAERRGQKLTWMLGTLPPQSERRIRLELRPESEGEFVSPARVTFGCSSATMRTRVGQPQLAVRHKGQPSASPGQPLTLKLEIANPGTVPVTGIVLRNELPAGLEHPAGRSVECDIGELKPGESRDVTLTVQARVRGRFTNEVIATADGGLKARDVAVVHVGQAELRLNQLGPRERHPNSEAQFVLELENMGDGTARNVVILNPLPSELSFRNAGEGGHYDHESRTVTWQLDHLPPGESRRMTLTLVPTGAGVISNRVVARAEGNVEARAEVRMAVLGVAALELDVDDGEDPLALGSETNYVIRVRNQGTGESTNVQMLVLVPEGLAIVQATGDSRHRVQGRQVIYEPLSRLEPRTEKVYRVRVRGEAVGNYRVKVQMQSDQLRLPVCAEESTQVFRE